MAKRKLSQQDRSALRTMLTRGVAKETPQAQLLKSVAKKYGISTETARGYLKSLSNGKAGKKKAATSRKSVRKSPRARRRKSSGNGQASAPALVRRAQAAAQARAQEAATLKRLLPEYRQVRRNQEKLAHRLQEVRQMERAVSGALRQAVKRAKKLEAQLRGLVKG